MGNRTIAGTLIMAKESFAGPGEGTERPADILVEHVFEYGEERLFIGWSGNGYKEEDCWILADEAVVADLNYWE